MREYYEIPEGRYEFIDCCGKKTDNELKELMEKPENKDKPGLKVWNNIVKNFAAGENGELVTEFVICRAEKDVASALEKLNKLKAHTLSFR